MPVLRRILVPTDFSLHARGALQYALVLGARLSAEVQVLHVCSDGAHIVRLGALQEATDLAVTELEGAARRAAEAELAEFMKTVEGPDVPTITEVEFDDPFDAIIARAENFDLVVMGTHGRRGLERIVMGSLTEKVLRAVPVPVVTYRWPKQAPLPRPGVPKRILVPVDFSDGARAALELALRFADAFEAAVEVLHVVPQLAAVDGAELLVEAEGSSKLPFDAWSRSRAATDMEAFVRPSVGEREVSTRVEVGDPGRTICEVADHAGHDLVVMGTHGRVGVDRLMMGSVAERVAREAPCPVATCRR